MDKKQQFHLWYVAAAIGAVLLFQSWWTTYRTVEPLAYSEFIDNLKKGQIAEVSVSQDTISGKFKAQSGVPLGVTYGTSPSSDLTGSTDGGRVIVLGKRLNDGRVSCSFLPNTRRRH